MTHHHTPYPRPTNHLTCNNYPPLPAPYRLPTAPVGHIHQPPSRRPDPQRGAPAGRLAAHPTKGHTLTPMFWCEKCDTSYPHGPEGPSEALQKHAAERHQEPDRTGPPTITGRHVVLGSLALAALAWIGRNFGHS
ncbi:hypothetical protein GCM10020227_11280 [Streptomyces flavovirens]